MTASPDRVPPAALGPFGFHAHSGWYFRREEDGAVRILAPDSQGTYQMVNVDANTWASVVASVSAAGDTGETFRKALAFHQGGEA